MRTNTKACYFCQNNKTEVDYKDADLLQKFISGQAKILNPKRTGTCAKHQRQVSKAIKRARILGLLPFIKR